MGKALTQQLDEACATYDLEWLVLPFDPSPESWRLGPYWGALVAAQFPPRRGRAGRFFRYNGEIQAPYLPDLPDPDVIYLMLEPSGRKEVMRLLLAQLA